MGNDVGCDKCNKDIKKGEKFFVCDSCGRRFCISCGYDNKSCTYCVVGKGGKLHQKVAS